MCPASRQGGGAFFLSCYYTSCLVQKKKGAQRDLSSEGRNLPTRSGRLEFSRMSLPSAQQLSYNLTSGLRLTTSAQLPCRGPKRPSRNGNASINLVHLVLCGRFSRCHLKTSVRLFVVCPAFLPLVVESPPGGGRNVIVLSSEGGGGPFVCLPPPANLVWGLSKFSCPFSSFECCTLGGSE